VEKEAPGGVFVSTPSVMLWKCTFRVSSSLTRSTAASRFISTRRDDLLASDRLQ
jgi:hypothetical protein